MARATKPASYAPSIGSMISNDPPQIGSEHAWRLAQLREGMDEYDWDNQGTRVQVREDWASAVTQKVDELVRVVGSISEVLGFRQEPEPTVQPDLQPFGIMDQPKSSQPKLPLPQTMRDIWSEARKTRAGKPAPLVPAAVRASYRLPPDDWAFFGAIRRPDESLLEHCRTKPSARQVPVLQRSADGMAHDSFLSDVVQATAHLARPLAHGAHAVTMVSSTISVIMQLMPEMPEDLKVLLKQSLDSLRLATTVFCDTTDCAARLNAHSLRTLRNTWIEAANVPLDVKLRAKNSNLVPGVPPEGLRMEFTAPLVGESLKAEVGEAVERNKRSKVLKQSMSTLDKGSKKGSKWQRNLRQRSKSPQPPPAKKAKEQSSYKRPPAKKQENKSWQDKKSQPKSGFKKDFRRGGRGRGNQGS